MKQWIWQILNSFWPRAALWILIKKATRLPLRIQLPSKLRQNQRSNIWNRSNLILKKNLRQKINHKPTRNQRTCKSGRQLTRQRIKMIWKTNKPQTWTQTRPKIRLQMCHTFSGPLKRYKCISIFSTNRFPFWTGTRFRKTSSSSKNRNNSCSRRRWEEMKNCRGQARKRRWSERKMGVTANLLQLKIMA